MIVSNDDGARGRNFRVAPLLWPGEYFVRVTPWVSSSGSIETGSYSLHAEGTPASIAQLPLDGSSKQGVIEPGEDADYFRIEAAELTEMVIRTAGGSYVNVTVLDADGREILSDDGEGWGNVRLTVLLQAGEYYVRGGPGGRNLSCPGRRTRGWRLRSAGDGNTSVAANAGA